LRFADDRRKYDGHKENRAVSEAVVTDVAAARSGAGQDPRKRQQIIDGARRLFLAEGFDAASMGEIAKAAGVSKGTLYVYFESKEELFAELVRIEKDKHFSPIFTLDPNDHDVEAVLRRLGHGFCHFITLPHVVMGKRTMIAIGTRMPEVTEAFFREGPGRCGAKLAEYLDAQVAAGRLAVPDTPLAAAQFLGLVQAEYGLRLLFGIGDVPAPEEAEKIIESAVRMFMAAYGVPSAPAG
jgi:AcrR family transcriptional regulator